MPGISGRSHLLLLQALNDLADGSRQPAPRVKLMRKKIFILFNPLGVIFVTPNFSRILWYSAITQLLINFHAKSGFQYHIVNQAGGAHLNRQGH